MATIRSTTHPPYMIGATHRPPCEDDARAVAGIVNGVVLSTPFWLLVLMLACDLL
jgi:hypothetical protein